MNIQFEPVTKESYTLFSSPKPATQSIPVWYKNMPVHLDGEKEDALAKNSTASSNLTLKGCSPFLDALSSGYIIELPFDIEFRVEKEGINIRWATGINYITEHSLDQAPGLPAAFDGKNNILKWTTGWKVVTPPGYSCLFTHPLNRHDLPFRTFSGVVETDLYSLATDFPFQLINNFDKDIYILEKGTPLVQIFPFKRDEWNSSILKYNEEKISKGIFELKSTIVRSYKNNFWKKKSYK